MSAEEIDRNERFTAAATLGQVARRTEQGWWQELVEPHRDRSSEFRTHFLAGRPRFGAPGNIAAEGVGSPTFGCVLLVWRATP